MTSISVGKTLILPISSLSAMYLVYGGYAVLFGTCIYLMRRKDSEQGHERQNRSLYLALTTILFVLTSMFVVSYTMNIVRNSLVAFAVLQTGDIGPLKKYSTHDVGKTVLLTFDNLIPILLNSTAELMLIHRCYLIWDRSKRVAVPIITISVLINTLGLVSVIIGSIGISDSHKPSNYALYQLGRNSLGTVYDISSTANNFILTSLTAGRIWWVHRQVRAHGVIASDSLIRSVLGIIIESGMLYPIFGIISLVKVSASTASLNAPFDFFPFVVLSNGIALTVILIRAKLGKNVESLQESISDIRFGSHLGQHEDTTTTRSQLQLHSIRNLNTALTDIRAGNEEQKEEVTSI